MFVLLQNLQLPPQGINKLTAHDAEGNKIFNEYKPASVVSQDLAFGMARMYEMLTSDNISNIGIFREMEEAKDWLSIK